MNAGALDGIRVVDFSRILAGPMATMILGDLGADVIKVEHPRGDDTRGWGPPYAGDSTTYFQALNRNKRGIAIDLSTVAGRQLARRLCLTADVVVDNFRPGTMARWGLAFDQLADERPDIVTCSISGFGTSDAGAALAGYDVLVQAASGLMSLTGERHGPSVKTGVAIVDQLAGLYAVIGVLSALRHRDRTGAGQHVSTSLLGAALAGLANAGSAYLGAGVVQRRDGNRHPSIAPYQPYATADDTIVIAVGSESLWATLCAAIGRNDLATDPRFADNAVRVAHVDELQVELEQVLTRRPAAEWTSRLTAAGIPCGPINDVAAAFDFATRIGLDPVSTLSSEGAPEFRSVRSPIGLSATPPGVRLRPPRIDEHGDDLRARFEPVHQHTHQPARQHKGIT